MKRILRHALSLNTGMLLACLSLAVAGPARDVRADEASVEQELKNIDRQWLHAATVQDVDYLKQLFADGMFEVQNGGSVVTGAEMRRYLAIPGRKVDITIDDVQVRGVYGGTAVLTDHTTQTGMTADGRKITGEYTVLRVLRKIDGKWRAIGAEMTPLKAATSARAHHDETAERPESELSPIEKEIVALDHKWVDAATRGDTAFLKTLFGEKMFEVQPDGHAAPAAEMLERIATRKPGQIEGYCDQVQVRGVYGDTVILTDRRVRKGRAANGQDVSGQWRVTRVFVKQNGKWRAVAGAMTPVQ
jgi:ketosteroid isomerase-like protein